ncbi:unnamed protein product [Phytophthora lilii]|uniref:Unnamed protein product n=1 Tax=Phytophthora lilii TaxID=2077276 RepID=A0A9W6TD50_9STRA|nr:unnamed protein product [Phytophthora lilii]
MSETQLSNHYLYQSSLKSDPEIKVSSSKRTPFVIILNQGSYQNGVITIDAMAQLNGSEGFASLRDAYIMLPYKVSMKNGATAQTTAANRLCTTLKCGNWNVIDSLSLELNGKTIVSMADYKLFWNNVRAQTGYSPHCPIMIASAATGNPMASVLATSAAFSVSWGAVVNSLEPTIDGTYMPSTTARLYVPFIHLENPQAIISKPVKKIGYNDCHAQWFYQRAGIGKQSTQFNASFGLQLSASVKNAKYVVVLPFAEQTSSFATAAVQEFQAPSIRLLGRYSQARRFATSTSASVRRRYSISVMTYDFHQFTNEVAKIGAINGDLTPELVNGLLDYQT